MAADSRRTLIEFHAKGTAEDLLYYLQEKGVELPVRPENTRKTSLYFAGQQPSGCLIEEGADNYTKGRNGGRVILANANPGVANSETSRGEKVRRVVYHLSGIIFVRMSDPEADIGEFPGKYRSATDPKMAFSLRESPAERMERITGKPIDFDVGKYKQEDPKKGGYRPEGGKGSSTQEKAGPKEGGYKEDTKRARPPSKGSDPKREDLNDKIEDLLARIARGKQETWDPNQGRDFGYGFELSDVGYEDPDAGRLEKLDRSFSAASSASGRMSEEFQVARIIMVGKGGEENWKRVFRNLLLEDEGTSVAYLKGIYNY